MMDETTKRFFLYKVNAIHGTLIEISESKMSKELTKDYFKFLKRVLKEAEEMALEEETNDEDDEEN